MASAERIAVLPDDVIDRIAAGEVIERPASVVKELCENSFDAGASAVEVHLDDGGLGRVTVSDDGCGMSPGDARRCVLRHATSKLRSADDLFAITTYGFRGEALSSIAAVARVAITTRRPEDLVGTRVVIAGGEVLEAGEVGCPIGTTIDVRELFFNTPARRKFMRSPATEQAHAVLAARQVALGYARGGLVVATGERRLLDVPEAGPPAERTRAAIGEVRGELFPFARQVGDVSVRGFVAAPALDRSDAKGLWFFVNGRFVRDRVLQRALLDAYRGVVASGRYPVAVVHVDLPPAAVDVNVHPQKLEVRFADGAAVFRALAAAITAVLAEAPWRAGASRSLAYVGAAALAARAGETFTGYASAPVPAQVTAQEPLDLQQGELFGAGFFARLAPLGLVRERYLVCDATGGLVLVDLRAARARLALERLRREREGGQVLRQQLLFPEPVELSASEQGVLIEQGEGLARFGFEIEPVSPTRLVVRSVPAALAAAPAQVLVRELVAALTEGAGADAVLTHLATHAGLSTEAPSREAVRSVLVALDGLDLTSGRPVHHVIAASELERWFGGA